MTTARAAWFVTIGAVVGACSLAQSEPAAVPGTPVLVELFTSEGCSSCPPADALLAQLASGSAAGGATIVALGEHVDYWDELGWRDRFSSHAFTERQQRYSRVFNIDAIYTPEMVVDGREEFVGSDARAAAKAIASTTKSPHGVLSIAGEPPDGDRITVAVSARSMPRSSHPELIVALTEGRVQSDVKRGENKGRVLGHTAVVRAMASAGELRGEAPTARGELTIPADCQRANASIVAFVQDRDTRRIVASSSIPLSSLHSRQDVTR